MYILALQEWRYRLFSARGQSTSKSLEYQNYLLRLNIISIFQVQFTRQTDRLGALPPSSMLLVNNMLGAAHTTAPPFSISVTLYDNITSLSLPPSNLSSFYQYTGQWINGRREGSGELLFPGYKFKGNFIDDNVLPSNTINTQ